jgi:antigen flippase
VRRAGTLVRDLLGAQGGLLAMVQTVIAQGLTMGVNIATGVITARLLGPVGRGEFGAVGLWLLLPSMLATAGLQNAVIYRVRQLPTEAGSIGAAGLIAAIVAFVPLAALGLWLIPLFMHAYPANIVFLARIGLVSSVISVALVMTRQWLLSTQRFGLFNAMVYGNALGYLLLLVLLIPAHAITPTTATYAQILATLLTLSAVAPLVFVSMRKTFHHPFAQMRSLIHYSLRAAPIDLVTVLSQNVDRLVLVVLISAADFGLYVVALSFARILLVLQTAISAVMLSDLANRPLTEVALFTQRGFRLLLWVLVPACGAVLLVDAPLLEFVYGPSFAAAVPVFRILLLDAALTCLAQILIQAFLARNAAGVPSMIQVASFAVSAGGVLVLAPILGSTGAAIALAVGSLLRLGLLLAALRRIGIGLPGIILRWADLQPVLRRFGLPAPAGTP